jgi:hypothetical protein
MRNRSLLGALLIIGVLIPITSCTSSPSLTSIAVTPTTMNFGGAGITTQLTAIGSYTHPGHPAITKDITGQVNWTSATPDCVTVSSTGLITSQGDVCSNILISASMPGFNGLITGTMTVNVTQPSGGSGGGGTGNVDVTTIAIIPTSQSVQSPGETAQFLAIGTASNGATVNLTNLVTWASSSVQIATISAAGTATAVGQGTATITALFTNLDGTAVTGVATFTVMGGASEAVTALTIIPGSEALAASQTGQFIALGTSGTSGLETDVTSSPNITWSSSVPTIATVSATGLATGVSAGSTSISAIWTNADGSVVSASATVSVSLSAAPEPLLSLTIIPSSISVGELNDTGQFLAIGTFSTTPNVRDLTNTVTWLSSAPNTFPISTNTSNSQGRENAGVASAFGSGSATIIAEATDPTTGSVQTATATFSCPLTLPSPNSIPPLPGSCYPGSQVPELLSTLTVYNEGLNTTNWYITAPSATGTANVIHCGPGWTGSGGSVCTATYPVGSSVILTAPAGAGAFGGWSSNCTPSDATGAPLPGPVFWTAGGPNYCVVSLTIDDTVGAIFN